MTEYNYTSAVPAFPGWNGGSPSGSPGLYDVVFVLGVPGVSGVARALDFDGMMAGGDSLLEGTGLQVELQSSDGSSLSAARIIPNAHGRLAQVRLTVTAGDFSLAENEASDAVMPTLSRIAFEADTPLEVTGVLLTEQATQTRRFGATLVGAVQPAPELAGTTTPELRMFLAAYREGLNDLADGELQQRLTTAAAALPGHDRVSRLLGLLDRKPEAAYEIGRTLGELVPDDYDARERLLRLAATGDQGALVGYLYALVEGGTGDAFDQVLDSAAGVLGDLACLQVSVRGPQSHAGWARVSGLIARLNPKDGARALLGWHTSLAAKRLQNFLADWLPRINT